MTCQFCTDWLQWEQDQREAQRILHMAQHPSSHVTKTPSAVGASLSNKYICWTIMFSQPLHLALKDGWKIKSKVSRLKEKKKKVCTMWRTTCIILLPTCKEHLCRHLHQWQLEEKRRPHENTPRVCFPQWSWVESMKESVPRLCQLKLLFTLCKSAANTSPALHWLHRA